MVEVSDGSITVVEGNSSDRVQKLSYPRSSGSIAGYGHPWYEKASAAPEEPQPAPPAEDPAPSPQTVLVRLPLLKPGATGPAVESAQLLLIHRGYNCGGRKFLGRETPDGDFGPASEKAVRSFQTKAALAIDGILGPLTWEALLIKKSTESPA